uniref:Uncharacterized protein n=2 Tax=Meloidogyne TaxID=189290 RepID=A0A6V7V3T4_MELEN|nr:unnamed protein product [Meloidogyne enterolobii]
MNTKNKRLSHYTKVTVWKFGEFRYVFMDEEIVFFSLQGLTLFLIHKRYMLLWCSGKDWDL